MVDLNSVPGGADPELQGVVRCVDRALGWLKFLGELLELMLLRFRHQCSQSFRFKKVLTSESPHGHSVRIVEVCLASLCDVEAPMLAIALKERRLNLDLMRRNLIRVMLIGNRNSTERYQRKH